MKVSELREVLASLPDDQEVLIKLPEESVEMLEFMYGLTLLSVADTQHMVAMGDTRYPEEGLWIVAGEAIMG